MRFFNFDVRFAEAKPRGPICVVRFVEAPCAFFFQIAVSSRRCAFCKLVDALWNPILMRPYRGSLRFFMVAELLLFTNRRLVETQCVLQIFVFLQIVVSSRRRAFCCFVFFANRRLVETPCALFLQIVVSPRRGALVF